MIISKDIEKKHVTEYNTNSCLKKILSNKG